MSLSAEASLERAHPISPPLAYGLSLVMVLAATLAALAVERLAPVPNLSLIFVLPVVTAAVTFGWGPALAAAVLGVAACNYYLIEPRHTLRVADSANVWALALLLIVAGLVSAVAARSRRRALEALRSADQAAAVHTLARSLMGAADRPAIARACAEALARLFQAPAAVLLETGDSLAPAALAGGAALSEADMEAATWAEAARLATRGGAYPVHEAAFDFWPVITRRRRRAVIGLLISGRDAGRPASPEHLVEIVTGYLAVALDRDDYAAEALEGRLRAAGQEVRETLLAAVSHDLKTPLSTILVTLQSLRKFGPAHDAASRAELLGLAEAEAARLSAMVANILDVSRLNAGALSARARPVAVAELVADAVRRAAPALAGRRLVDEASACEPPLMVDPDLFQSALANVLENAGKYAPDGSTIHILAGAADGLGWIEVLDEGVGFPGPVEPLFETYARGVEGDGRPPGVGLGLAIARRFLEAQGGRVEAANRGDGPGAWVRLWAPLAEGGAGRA